MNYLNPQTASFFIEISKFWAQCGQNHKNVFFAVVKLKARHKNASLHRIHGCCNQLGDLITLLHIAGNAVTFDAVTRNFTLFTVGIVTGDCVKGDTRPSGDFVACQLEICLQHTDILTWIGDDVTNVFGNKAI